MPMRHRLCGRVALHLNEETVLDPSRKLMASDVILPHGDEPRAGVPIRCVCGVTVRLTPEDLEVDRGPDAKTSFAQRFVLALTRSILP